MISEDTYFCTSQNFNTTSKMIDKHSFEPTCHRFDNLFFMLQHFVLCYSIILIYMEINLNEPSTKTCVTLVNDFQIICNVKIANIFQTIICKGIRTYEAEKDQVYQIKRVDKWRSRDKEDDLIKPMRTFSTEFHTESKQSSRNSRNPKAHSPPATMSFVCNCLGKGNQRIYE